MQWLIAAFSNQFHQFLVIQSIKHPFIQFSRHTVECRLIPVKNGDRVTTPALTVAIGFFFSSLTLALVSDRMMLGITHL